MDVAGGRLKVGSGWLCLTYDNAKSDRFVGASQPVEELSNLRAIQIILSDFSGKIALQAMKVGNLESRWISKGLYIALVIDQNESTIVKSE